MTKRRFYFDLLERTAWTFVQAFAAAWIVLEGASFDAFFSQESLEMGAVAGVIAVLKGIVATRIGHSDDASTLPKEATRDRDPRDPQLLGYVR